MGIPAWEVLSSPVITSPFFPQLDYATDARLRRAIQENYGDLTSIIVAQRISSIYRADKIIVLEDGEMIGYGTHKNLMESCEVYREISQSQMGGGIDEA